MSYHPLKKIGIVTVAVMLCVLASAPLQAASIQNYVGYVERVQINSNSAGICSARISRNPRITQPTCASFWVTFDCAGDFISKEVAYRMFDQAQMAAALNRRVIVTVDENYQKDGVCLASRIDVIED